MDPSINDVNVRSLSLLNWYIVPVTEIFDISMDGDMIRLLWNDVELSTDGVLVRLLDGELVPSLDDE